MLVKRFFKKNWNNGDIAQGIVKQGIIKKEML